MASKEVKNSKDKTSFFKSFRAELKKVVWPTPKQLFNNTVAVLVIVLITTLIVFVLDIAFESMNKYGIDKIRDAVVNTTEETTDSDTEGADETESDVVEDGTEVVTDENAETTEEVTETETTTENVTE